MADLQKIVDELSKLTVLEAADLAKILEDKWQKGIPASGLSDEDLKSARANLEVWCSPQEFIQKIEVLAKKITSETLFNSPKLRFLLDAMILGEFARQLDDARRVRLTAAADRFPDGFVETVKGTLNIEVTEVTGRHGDEEMNIRPAALRAMNPLKSGRNRRKPSPQNSSELSLRRSISITTLVPHSLCILI